MAFTLTVRNYRGLRHVEWSPSGVCALVGPNGSGKTTLIDVLQLLHDTRTRDFTKAVEAHGGAYGIRHFDAASDAPVEFGLRIGSANWIFQPEVRLGPGGAHLPVREKLTDGDVNLFSRVLSTSGGNVPLLGTLLLAGDSGMDHMLEERAGRPISRDVRQLAETIASYRHYRHYALQSLRREGSSLGGDLRLLEDGRNLFSVLMNWRNRREYREHWALVTDTLRDCFPGVFEDFSFPIAANIVSCEVHTPRNATLTPALLPDGFLVALLHLCAVVSAQPGGVIAIDEAENALHPYAIRRLMDAFREWSDAHDVTILLATHSPVILDTFKELPDKVFVMEPGHAVLPVSLDTLKKRDWLAHFSLGDLYEHLEYGAPKETDGA
jgi:predicted ATPase